MYTSLATRQYGEGRLTIVTDRVGGYRTGHGNDISPFWRKILEWTGQRGVNETVRLGIIISDFTDYAKFLSNIKNVSFEVIDLPYVSMFDVSKFDIIYFIGLPESVGNEAHTKLNEYVVDGGGILVEVPDRGGEYINVLTSFDYIYCTAYQRPIFAKSYWTQSGRLHYSYDDTVNLVFMTTLESSAFSSAWDILTTETSTTFEEEINKINPPEIKTLGSTASEFSISYLIAMQKGITEVNNLGTLVDYNYLQDKIYSAENIDRIVGVFLSDILYPSSSFIRWHQVTWTGTSTNKNIGFYVRSASSIEDISIASWYGPYYESTFDISSLNGFYFQIMSVLVCDSVNIPSINSLVIDYFSSQTTVKFFTKTFTLDFNPKTVLLTYNADESNDTIIRFAISGDETIDSNEYQYIDPNKIVELKEINTFSNSVKIMIEMAGTNSVPIVLHEFALMFGGNSTTEVNEVNEGSSSSSS